SVTGIARMYIDPQSRAFALKRNDQLEPGNIIETDLNGRVVISLTDGGQITVLPNSKVILKNFQVAHSARELLDIMVGRVLVKIRHFGGKPNPYRLNSPAASIAVRGTEFIVDVITGGETLVVVREGQVEVWPHNNPNNKRLVAPGGRVIVRPGGDISSAFPGPGSELNGRTRFYGNLEDDYQRSVDSIAQNSNEISPVFFSAFADPHFDSLENPAYAAEFKNAEGRLLLLPSISAPYRLYLEGDSSSKDPPSFDYSISPQLTFYTPIPDSRLVVGGGASALRTRLQDLTDFQFPDYKYYDYQALRLNAFNISLIAAYSFGVHGRTSAGIGIDRLSGDGTFLSDYRFKTDRFNIEYLDNSNARFARTRLTLGLVHRFSESKKIGLYYRHGVNSSDQVNQYRQRQEDVSHPDASYSQFGKTNISTLSSELGIRFRAPLTRRLFYGIEGSYLYERIRSRRETLDQPIAHKRYLARRARIGGGLGFFLTSKILLNFDVAGGLFNNTQPVDDVPSFDGNIFASSLSSPRSSRGEFLSAHAAIQTNLWRNLFLSASNLTTVRRDFITYRYDRAEFGDKDAENIKLSNAGIGWNFKPNLAAEYLLSIDHRYRIPSHSLKLRYTFNLSINGER
ncbi:MAG: FecR family protein, partial [Blastocatellia bacterium]